MIIFTISNDRRPISLQARATLRASVCRFFSAFCLSFLVSTFFELKFIQRFGKRLPDVCCPHIRRTTTTTTTTTPPPPPQLISPQVFGNNAKMKTKQPPGSKNKLFDIIFCTVWKTSGSKEAFWNTSCWGQSRFQTSAQMLRGAPKTNFR